jgi:hypothetical protein
MTALVLRKPPQPVPAGPTVGRNAIGADELPAIDAKPVEQLHDIALAGRRVLALLPRLEYELWNGAACYRANQHVFTRSQPWARP